MRCKFNYIFKLLATVVFVSLFSTALRAQLICPGLLVDGNPCDLIDIIQNAELINSPRVDPFNAGNQDDRLTGGSKNTIDFPLWAHTVSSVGDKVDFQAAVVAQIGSIIYVAADRYAQNGDAEISFWLLLSPLSTNANGTFTGVHTIGDLLFTSKFTQGGGKQDIFVYKWIGGSNPLQLQATFGAAVNEGEVDVPSVFQPFKAKGNNSILNKYPRGAFLEGAVDLSKIPDVDPCFSTVLILTSESQSNTETVVDFRLSSFDTKPKVDVNNQNGCPSKTYKFKANGSGGIAPLTYEWYVDGVIQPTVIGNELTLGPPATDKDLTVKVIAIGKNNCKSDPATGTLDVTCSIPTIECPANKTIKCTDDVVFDLPTAKDNCDPDPQIIKVGDDVKTPGNCPQEYTITRTWKAVDACGNESAPCSQTITVVDDEAPTIYCAADKTIGCNEVVVFDPPTAKDNCDPEPTIEIVSTTVVGNVHTRTWRAVDDCGNTSATCSQSITVPACAHLFPTQTTCCNYLNGPTSIFQQRVICTALDASGKVTNATPGVFFYFGDYTQNTSSSVTLIVLQKCNAAFFKVHNEATSQVQVLTSNCQTISANVNINSASGKVTITFNAAANQKYVISVKYSAKSIEGFSVPGGTKYAFGLSKDGSTYLANSNGELETNAGSCSAETPNASGSCPATTTTAVDRTSIQPEVLSPLSVTAVPNPYNDRVRFSIGSPVSGQGTLELFNMLGQKVQTVYQGYLEAGRTYDVDYRVPATNRENLIYILRIGDQRVTGKLINRR